MVVELRVPTLGESITEAVVAKWYRKAGDVVSRDEPLVELETEKVTVEVPAPVDGVLSDTVAKEGDTVEIGAVLGTIASADQLAKEVAPAQSGGGRDAAVGAEPGSGGMKPGILDREKSFGPPPSPSARKLMEERGLSASQVEGSGRRGQVLKSDVLDAVADSRKLDRERGSGDAGVESAREERVRMSGLRRTIAKRLKEAQNTAAMLTTFNEVDMTAVMNLRNDYKDVFEKRHGVKLGFMSFFVGACVRALHDIPAVNAEIDGTDIVYKNYYHIGVAVGTVKGLVVPVVRDADRRSLAEIEKVIADFGHRAKEGRLGAEEMSGGTFTISNGGVYGSLMSTPILNSPQSGILGMHKIQQRPVVAGGEVVVRPMMYLALSYDHRIVDGKEAVTFLVRIKDLIEDPRRWVLDL